MDKWPAEVEKEKVIKVFEKIGFKIVRIGNHISMVKINTDGSKIPLTMPNHRKIKGVTLRIICRQSGIKREEFLKIYREI